MNRILKSALLAAAGVAAFAAVLPRFARAWRQAVREQRLSRAVMIEAGGFGHTLTSPDLIRRALGADCGVVFFGPSWRYNPRVAELFSDVRVTIAEIPTAIRLFGRPISVPTVALVDRVLLPALEWRWRRLDGKRIVQPAKLADLVELRTDRSLPVYRPRGGGGVVESPHVDGVRDYIAYLIFSAHPGHPPAALPEAALRRCREALDAALAPGRRTAALYVRRRESAAGDATVLARNGGGPEDYLPAIDWLIERGYNVLAAGDLDFAPALAPRHRGRFSDGTGLAIDRNLFLLYAATACDVWIGECGGGATIPWVARRPMLGVNWFPFSICYPGMTVCYKTLHPKDADAVCGFAETFGPGAFAYVHAGRDLRTNPADLMRAAVADFVTSVETGAAPGAPPSALGPVHPDVALEHVPAYVSRPWIAYCESRGAAG